MTSGIVLPSIAALVQLHSETIQLHGGAQGVPDHGLLDACLARVEQLSAYGEGEVTVLLAAAAVAFAIIKIHHPAPDGNKRLGLLALNITLGLNGWRLDATERETERIILDVASGAATEKALADWIAANAVKRSA